MLSWLLSGSEKSLIILSGSGTFGGFKICSHDFCYVLNGSTRFWIIL